MEPKIANHSFNSIAHVPTLVPLKLARDKSHTILSLTQFLAKYVLEINLLFCTVK